MNKEQYAKAIELLNLYAYHYYVLDDPMTTDEVYDKLYHEVLEYEEHHGGDILPSSPTQRVEMVSLKGLKKAAHLSRMWSLEDVLTLMGCKMAYKTYKLDSNISFYCETKYDGASLNLIYENGILLKASRGEMEVWAS